MKVEYSKDFEKSVRKLSGKLLESVKEVIREVMAASNLSEISDCKKLVGYECVYRIRIGNLRAFFTFHIEIKDDTVLFRYLVSRGEAYGKEMTKKLKKKDF